jgi:hypothetical protein
MGSEALSAADVICTGQAAGIPSIAEVKNKWS